MPRKRAPKLLTVADLIALLQTFPQTAHVFTVDPRDDHRLTREDVQDDGEGRVVIYTFDPSED